MKKKMKSLLGITAMTLALSATALEIKIDKADGIYETGKDTSITFTINGLITEGFKDTNYFQPGVPGEEKIIDENTRIRTFQMKDLHPGWLYMERRQTNTKGHLVGKPICAGVIIDPFKIKAGAAKPADFDAFWDNEIKKMRSVPMNPVLEEVKLDDKRIRAWKFKLDCGDNNFAYGYISMPAKADAKSLPAIAQFHGASTMGLRNAPTYYAYSSIHVTMSPHQSECGQDREYYKEFEKSIRGYNQKDVTDRDKYYMKGMILRVLRTLEFIKTCPEWNGKDLITHGESQGGFQSLAGAALDKDVSFCLAMVPAMSDHLGFKQGNPNGWPWVIAIKDGKPVAEDFAKKAELVLPYYDNVNFATRITCPIWISTGLLDKTCPPSGVLAVYNNLPADTEKHIYIAPKAGHGAGYPGVAETLHSIVKPPPAK